MKKALFSILTLALVCSINFNSGATIHVVTAGDNLQFVPGNLSFPLGDTVRWVFPTGATMPHTTTSVSIPTGAVSWNENLNSVTPSYDYVPAVVGQYDYTCTIHVGMNGSFTVTPPTSIRNTPAAQVFCISPNPAKNEIRIRTEAKDMNVELIDVTGRCISLQSSNNAASVEKTFFLPEIADGLYMIRVRSGNEMVTEKLLVEK